MKKKDKIIISISLIGCLLFMIFALIYFQNPFVESYTIEAGASLKIDDLLEKKARNPSFMTKIDNQFLKKVGDHTIKVKGNDGTFQIRLKIIDTIAPTAKVSSKKMWIGDSITPDIFVSDIKDATNVKVSFKTQPNLNKTGKQKITIVLTDQGQNKKEYQTELNLKKDTEAPIISTINTILSNQGEPIQYKKNTKITDNRDKDINLQVDSSKVDYNRPGTYYALLSATDKAGNQSTKKVKVIILNKSDANYKAEAHKLVKTFVNRIAKNKKTKQEKLKTCFDYIRENMVYDGLHQGSIDNYYIDAVTGLKTWHGDCLVSNGVLRVVCEELNVPTMVVKRTSQKKWNHYWFLANTGDGWYHYDAFKRTNIIVYKMTNDQLLSWSHSHDGVMDFDRSQYPETPKK